MKSSLRLSTMHSLAFQYIDLGVRVTTKQEVVESTSCISMGTCTSAELYTYLDE